MDIQIGYLFNMKSKMMKIVIWMVVLFGLCQCDTIVTNTNATSLLRENVALLENSTIKNREDVKVGQQEQKNVTLIKIDNEEIIKNTTQATNNPKIQANAAANSTFSSAQNISNTSKIPINQTYLKPSSKTTPYLLANVTQLTPAVQNKKTPKLVYCGRKTLSRPKKFPKQLNPKARQRLVSTNYNFDMYVDAKDSTVSSAIAQSGTWEANYINVIGHIVKEGDKVLNLGSQSGLQALIMGKIVGPTGKLFIFEPYSFSNSLVTKNVELNGLQNITTIYKVGASDKKSTATIQISYLNTGGSQIVAKKPSKTKSGRRGPYNEQEAVELDRVDALLPADISLDFALIDVQKMEISAINGMKGIIERSPNLIIMSEWQYARNPRRNKDQTLKLLKYMVDQGYTINSYGGGNVAACKLGKFRKFDRIEDLLRIDFLDIFFIPKDYKWPK